MVFCINAGGGFGALANPMAAPGGFGAAGGGFGGAPTQLRDRDQTTNHCCPAGPLYQDLTDNRER